MIKYLPENFQIIIIFLVNNKMILIFHKKRIIQNIDLNFFKKQK